MNQNRHGKEGDHEFVAEDVFGLEGEDERERGEKGGDCHGAKGREELLFQPGEAFRFKKEGAGGVSRCQWHDDENEHGG